MPIFEWLGAVAPSWTEGDYTRELRDLCRRLGESAPLLVFYEHVAGGPKFARAGSDGIHLNTERMRDLLAAFPDERSKRAAVRFVLAHELRHYLDRGGDELRSDRYAGRALAICGDDEQVIAGVLSFVTPTQSPRHPPYAARLAAARKGYADQPGALGQVQEAPIDSLDPSIRVLADELLRRSPDALVITDGFRSREEQDRLYKQGRETPGPIVTNAKPGYSWHQYGLAFDVALLKDGKRTWPEDRSFWERVGALGMSLGLKWGGSFGDLPHFEYHEGITFEDAMNGKRPAVPSIGAPKKSGWTAAAWVLGLGAGLAWITRGRLW